MPIAFKEWAVTVRALAEGEQLITLRKGGIRGTESHFELEHAQFFLYPTFDHQAITLEREQSFLYPTSAHHRYAVVAESHQPELRRALEEGVWAEGEPSPHAWTLV